MTLLTNAAVSVDVVFSAVEIEGPVDGFGLSKWVRENRPGVQVVLSGSVVKAAHAAGDLCEEGPHLTKPLRAATGCRMDQETTEPERLEGERELAASPALLWAWRLRALLRAAHRSRGGRG